MQDPFARLRLRALHAGQSSPTPDWSWDTAGGLRNYDLVVVTQGQGVYEGGGERFEVQRGTAMCFRPRTRYQGRQRPGRPLAMAYIHFQFLDGRGRPAAPSPDLLPPLRSLPEDPSFLIALAQKAVAYLRRGHPSGAARWLGAALMELLSERERPRYRGYELEQSRRVEELCEAVRREPKRPWSLEAFANALSCSPDHAGRLFRKYAGRTPMDFVIDMRIQSAKSLLQSSSHSVARIGEILGYSDVYAFSKQFKARTGRSPTGYRGL